MISTYPYTRYSPADPHIQALLDYRPSEWSYLLKKIQIIEIFKKFADQSGKSEDYKAIIFYLTPRFIFWVQKENILFEQRIINLIKKLWGELAFNFISHSLSHPSSPPPSSGISLNSSISLQEAAEDSSPHDASEEEITLFNFAIASGNIQYLRTNYARLKETSEFKQRYPVLPVHFIVETGNLELVKYLIDSPAQTLLITSQGVSPLHLAVWYGFTEIATYLISLCPDCLNLQTLEGFSPLHLAVWRKQHETFFAIISESFGSTLLLKDNKQQTALHLAALNGDLAIVEALMKMPILVTHSNCLGQLPIHIAARQGNKKLVKLLVEKYPASIMTYENSGCMPIHLAIFSQNLKTIQYLCKKSPESISIVDRSNQLWLSKSNLRIYQFVVKNYQDGAVSHSGLSPIDWAALLGNLESLQTLFYNRPSHSTPSNHKWGLTPLHFAAIKSNATTLDWLANECSDWIISKDLKGLFPFHLAAICKRREAALQLLEKYYFQLGQRGLPRVFHPTTPLLRLEMTNSAVQLLIQLEATEPSLQKTLFDDPLPPMLEERLIQAYHKLYETTFFRFSKTNLKDYFEVIPLIRYHNENLEKTRTNIKVFNQIRFISFVEFIGRMLRKIETEISNIKKEDFTLFRTKQAVLIMEKWCKLYGHEKLAIIHPVSFSLIRGSIKELYFQLQIMAASSVSALVYSSFAFRPPVREPSETASTLSSSTVQISRLAEVLTDEAGSSSSATSSSSQTSSSSSSSSSSYSTSSPIVSTTVFAPEFNISPITLPPLIPSTPFLPHLVPKAMLSLPPLLSSGTTSLSSHQPRSQASSSRISILALSPTAGATNKRLRDE